MAKILRILVVEDSEDDALLVKRELERGGYEVVFERVETAETMTDQLKKQAWDIIISDDHLPHFSTSEALELLHHKMKNQLHSIGINLEVAQSRLKKKHPEDAEIMKFMELIANDSQKLNNVVLQFIKYTRMSDKERAKHDLRKLLEGVLK